MIFPLILGILLGALSVIFALQNITVITVSFFSWHVTGSLALLLMLAVAMGILISLLFVLPESIKNYLKYRSLRKENERLEEELRKQKELTVFAKNVPPSPDAIVAIEQGASTDPTTL